MTAIAEFALIERFFSTCGTSRTDCVLGVGDDAAILQVPIGMELVVTQDTLVAGVHFFPDVDPVSLGHKTLAVNLSDLAAMGAEPAWCTLSLTIPETDTAWLSAFAQGFDTLAKATGIQLVGGDTTCGPLALSVTAMGLVPVGQSMRRSGARPGDLVYVSGTLGDAGLALLELSQNKIVATDVRHRLQQPTPRLALGLALRGVAHAAIDISDGLIADLGHILTRSGVGADIQLPVVPKSAAMQAFITQGGDPTLLITAGDDYELCFTIAPGDRAELETRQVLYDCPITCIGEISAKPGLRLYGGDGEIIPLQRTGYAHF